MVVAAKYTGNDVDRADMRKLRLEQVVRRNFGRLAMFGFASTLICTWEVILVSLGLSLGNGGTAGLFWTYLITVVGLIFVYASLSELGSMIPTSGGQYFWVAVLAPPKYRNYLSYITGWLTTTSWQTSIAGSSYLAGTIIQSLFVLNIESYNYQRWHGTLLTLLVAVIAIIFNTFLARKLPLVEGLLVFCHVLGVAILIPLWILLPRREGGSPLVEFYNPSGWSSDGVSTMIGMLSTVIALIGFDCSVHMAEETLDSSRTIPVTLLTGFGANAVLGFFVMMTCIYTIGPLDTALFDSLTGYPFIDMFYQATGSKAATDVMSSVVIINFTASAIAVLATASRQLWSFARNKGMPFSSFLAPANLAHDIPINSIGVSFVFTALVSLLNIGSSAALNAIFSIANSALITSYYITIGCVLYRRLRGKLPPARYSLGKWGVWCNVISLLYLAPIYVFSFFPGEPKPTAEAMNWGIVMYGGIILIATAYYIIWGRHQFTPPRTGIDEMYRDEESYAHSASGVSEETKAVEAKHIAPAMEKEIASNEVSDTGLSDS